MHTGLKVFLGLCIPFFAVQSAVAEQAALERMTRAESVRTASPVFTQVLNTRYKYINQAANSSPLPDGLDGASYQAITPLSVNINCPRSAGCGLDISVLLDARVVAPSSPDLNLCTFIDGTGINCHWQNMPAGKHRDAAVNTFAPISAGSHLIQIKGRLFNGVFWEVYQGTARYTLLVP